MRVEVDADFAAWAGARERPFLHAAYVIRGDHREAERVVIGVLSAVAPRWERLRQDDPDAEARRLLYQEAVGGDHTRRDSSGGETAGVPHRWRGADPVVRKVLEGLSPLQRAALVLQCLEGRTARETATIMGVGVHAVESQTGVALAVVRDAVPAVRGLPGVAELLDGVTDHLPDVDLADRAWDWAAQRVLRRRRSVVATTVAVIGLGAIATVASSARSPVDNGPRPSPPSSAKASTVPPSMQMASDGTVLLLGPPPDVIANLPLSSAGIPGQVEWDPRAAPQPLTSIVAAHAVALGRADQRILYAVLSPRSVDSWVAVLLLRDDHDGSLNYASVDADLSPLGSAFGEPNAPLTARAIDPTGTRAAFVQPAGVVLVDVTTGRVRISGRPVADGSAAAPLTDGGFTDNGRLVVRSGAAAWSVDPSTLVWTRMPDASSPEVVRVEASAKAGRLVTLAPDGSPADAIGLQLPATQTWGQTVATQEWVATGGIIAAAAVPARFGADNALFLVSRKDPKVRRAVVLGAEAAGGVRTIGVAGRVVLFQYSVQGRTWVLGLDPATGIVSRVAEAWSPVAGVGSASQVIAISPWAIAHRANLAQGTA